MIFLRKPFLLSQLTANLAPFAVSNSFTQFEFKSYVSDLMAQNEQSRNSYMAVQNLRKAFPQILDEVKVAPFVEKLHGGPFLWIARAGTFFFFAISISLSSISREGWFIILLYF